MLLEKARNYIESKEITQSAFGKLIGLSESSTSRWFSGKLEGKALEKANTMVENFFEKETFRSQAVLSNDLFFAKTNISKQVEMTLTYCRAQRIIGIIHGDAGIGKTRTMQEWVYGKDDCIVITCTPVHNNIKGFLKLLAKELKVKRVGSIDDLYYEIYQKLQGADMMIIVDEAQHLAYKTIEILRSLNDSTFTALCLIGNDVVYKKLMGRQQAEFAQLFSRVGLRKSLSTKWFDIEDIKSVFGEADNTINEYLLEVSRSPFGLRGAKHLYINAKNSKDMSLKNMKTIAKMMGIMV